MLLLQGRVSFTPVAQGSPRSCVCHNCASAVYFAKQLSVEVLERRGHPEYAWSRGTYHPMLPLLRPLRPLPCAVVNFISCLIWSSALLALCASAVCSLSYFFLYNVLLPSSSPICMQAASCCNWHVSDLALPVFLQGGCPVGQRFAVAPSLPLPLPPASPESTAVAQG